MNKGNGIGVSSGLYNSGSSIQRRDKSEKWLPSQDVGRVAASPLPFWGSPRRFELSPSMLDNQLPDGLRSSIGSTSSGVTTVPRATSKKSKAYKNNSSRPPKTAGVM